MGRVRALATEGGQALKTFERIQRLGDAEVQQLDLAFAVG